MKGKTEISTCPNGCGVYKVAHDCQTKASATGGMQVIDSPRG